MAVKITKSRIMKDLRQMREDQLTEISKENANKVEAYKRELIAKHKDAIDKFIEKNKESHIEYNNLRQLLGNDPNIQMYTYSSSNLLGTGTCYENVESYVLHNSSWYKGSVQVFEDKLYEEKKKVSYEWNKLLVYLNSLTLKEIRKYVEDNNLELPCMKEEQEDIQALAVVDINLSLLFGK